MKQYVAWVDLVLQENKIHKTSGCGYSNFMNSKRRFFYERLREGV